MSRFYLVMIACLMAFGTISEVKAQTQKIRVSGIVQDEVEKIAMELVTVRVLKAKDSSFVTSATTDTLGRYTFRVNPGKYVVAFTYLGYTPVNKDIQASSSQPRLSMGIVGMQPNGIMLKEAVVVGKVPDVVVKQDTLEFNADSYKTQPNAVVEDLLKKLPGVEVDSDGKIKSGGKEIKKILVDGKEFFPDDPKMATKNLPVDMVDKLQVVDRKSDEARLTGVDDGNDETVINLTIKKGMNRGWFGNVQAGYGTQDRFVAGGMVGHFIDQTQFMGIGKANNTNNEGADDLGAGMYSGRGFGGNSGINTSGLGALIFNRGTPDKDKLVIGADARFVSANRKAWQNSERQNFLPDSTSYENSNSNSHSNSRNFNMNMRLRWQPDTLTTIDFMPQIGYNKSWNESNGTSALLAGNAARDSVNSGVSSSSNDGNGFNFNGRLMLNRKFKNKKGRQISLSMNYRLNDTEQDGLSYSENHFYLVDSTSIVRQRTDNHNWNGSMQARLSYVEPVLKNHFLSFAYSYRYNYNNADRFNYDLSKPGEPIDSLYSNRSRNKFNTHQGSIGLRGIREKFNYNVGMNVEAVRMESKNLIDGDRSVPARVDVNYSPFFNFMYRFDKQTYLRINYWGSSGQPSIDQLQPVKNITDPLRISKGNPDLNSYFNNSLNFNFGSFQRETQRAYGVYGRASVVRNSIVNKTFYDSETGIQTTMPINVNGVWNASVGSMFSTPFRNKKFSISNDLGFSYSNNIGYVNQGKGESLRNRTGDFSINERPRFAYRSDWFDFELGGNYSYRLTRNSLQGQQDRNQMNYGGSANVSVYLPWSIILGSDFNYTGREGYGTGIQKNVYMWNAEVSYQFLKGKSATLLFKIYDILKQRNSISRTVTGNYMQDTQSNVLTSYCMLSFTYRFNTFGKKGGSGPDGGPGRGREGDFRPQRGGDFRGRPGVPMRVF